ncbi:MAG: hypothetical protein AB2814_05820, partial [Candidatus Sedimenticola endophacoides]
MRNQPKRIEHGQKNRRLGNQAGPAAPAHHGPHRPAFPGTDRPGKRHQQRLQECRYLVKDFGISQSPKSTRQRDSRYCPDR